MKNLSSQRELNHECEGSNTDMKPQPVSELFLLGTPCFPKAFSNALANFFDAFLVPDAVRAEAFD
jgi:hypothetical protein